jgi:hypothetical protein
MAYPYSREPRFDRLPQRQNPLAEALAAIVARRNQKQQAPVEAPQESYYANDWLAPYLPDLSPLGRFTDMRLRQQAAQLNPMAVEAAKAQQMAQEIQRNTDALGNQVASFPSGGSVVTQQPTGPFPDAVSKPPTTAVAYSPSGQVVGSSTTAPSTQEATFGGMPASEWFQRAANRQGANKFAGPEPGYQGVPFSMPVTNDYNAWEKATAMIRKTKAK